MIKKIIRELYLIIIITISINCGSLNIISTAWASDPGKYLNQYVHNVWKTEDGLPQISVLAITQTKDGYIWLGTQEGLVRFDGVNFYVFNKNNTQEIKNNNIRVLFEDSKGNLWIGTNSGGLVLYQNGRFTLFTTDHGLTDNIVLAISEDSKGNLWIGTYNGGLNLYKNGFFTSFTIKDGLSSNSIFAIYHSKNNDIWIGTRGGGLNLFKDGKFVSFTTKDGLSSNIILTIYGDKSDNLWIGTNGGGLNLYKNGKFTNYTTKDGLLNNSVFAIHEDKNGYLWIGTHGGGLNFLKQGKFISSFTTENGLSDNIIHAIYKDKEGSFWIGTKGGGLNLYRKGKFSTFNKEQGLLDNMTIVVYEDKSKNLWVGTNNGGLNRYKNGKFNSYTTKNGLSNNSVFSLHEDHLGNLWIGTYGGGLNRFNPKRNKFTHYTVQDGLSSNIILSILEDSKSNLWVGTYNGGLNLFKNGKFIPVAKKHDISNYMIRTIYEDNMNNLWIGTNGGGLNLYKDGLFTSFTTENGLSSNMVFSMYGDKDNNLWIGTSDGGLNLLRNDRFTFFTEKEGLFADSIWVIMEDNNNNLWMSCNKGIFYVNKNDLIAYSERKIDYIKSTSYGVSDGMLSRECNGGSQPSGWKTEDGIMYFPTINGIVKVDPHNIQINKLEPPVHIEKVLADKVQLNMKNDISLPSDTDKIEFHYTGLSYLASQNVKFKYMLEGYDINWVDAGTMRTAYYTNLPPGKYNFKVTACNNDNIWNNKGTFFKFSKQPYLYQTFWFYILCLLLFISILILIFNIKNRKVRERQKELELFNINLKDEVARRTQELRSTNESLEMQNKLVEMTNLELAIMAEIGHKIASSLDIEEILITVYKNSNLLLPAEIFLIAFYLEDSNEIDFKFIIENDKNLPPLKTKLTEKTPVHWIIKNKKPLIINDIDTEPKKYGLIKVKAVSGNKPESLIYYPLIKNNRIIGAISVQSFSKNVYKKRHLDIIKTIASYTTAAIVNSDAFKQIQDIQIDLENQKSKLENQKTELELAHEKLKVLDEQKTRFFQNISHEFRTPLTLIIGPLEMLLKSSFDKEYTLKQIDTSLRNSRRLLRLINQLLDLSKFDAGKMKLQARELDLTKFLNTIVSSFESKAALKGLNLEFVHPSQDIFAYIDHEKFEKIVYNLLSNAIKFTIEGGVKILLKKDSENVYIQVIDTGKGISKKDIVNIFNRFIQEDDSSTKEQEGSGLGLSLVKEYIELHHGTIKVTSSDDNGSEFTISLPLGKRHLIQSEICHTNFDLANIFDNTQKQIQQFINEESFHGIPPDKLNIKPVEPKTIKSKHKNKILVVEDNYDMRNYIKDVLSADYEVLDATNGLNGLRLTRQEKPDLIISDVMMPKMDGNELLKELKNDESTKDIPVIILTAKASKDLKIEGLESGADDYLSKPFDPRELLARVKNILTLKTQALEIKRNIERILESQFKLVMAGEMMGDLFHELKNVFQESTFGFSLLKKEVVNIFNKLKLTDNWESVIDKMFSKSSFTIEERKKREEIVLKSADSQTDKTDKNTIIDIAQSLSDRMFNDEELVFFANSLLKINPTEREFFLKFVNIAKFFDMLQSCSTHVQELSYSVLNQVRTDDESNLICNTLEVIDSCMKMIEKRLKVSEIKSEVKITKSKNVNISTSSLHTVILNLLNNSNDAFSKSEQKNKTIVISNEISIDDDGDYITIIIEDNGPGIKKEVQNNIFDRSFTTKDNKGNGIGLTVSKSIIEKVGGSISFTSEQSCTRFYVKLPAA